MFLSLSKTMSKFGNIRLGLGIRLTKSNAAWMGLLMIFVWMFQLVWYMMLLCFWLVYAVCYALYLGIKAIYKKVTGNR